MHHIYCQCLHFICTLVLCVISGLYEKLCIPCIFILTYASMPWARPQRPQVRVGPKNAALPCLARLRPILCSRSYTRHTMYAMSRIGSFLYAVTYIGPMCVCPYIGPILYGQTHIGPVLYCLDWPSTILPGMHAVLPGIHWPHEVCYGRHWADNV